MESKKDVLPGEEDKTKKIVTIGVVGFILAIALIIFIGKSIEQAKTNKQTRHEIARKQYQADLASYNKAKEDYEAFRQEFIKNHSIYSLDFDEAKEIDSYLEFSRFRSIQSSIWRAVQSGNPRHAFVDSLDIKNHQSDLNKLNKMRADIPSKPTDPDRQRRVTSTQQESSPVPFFIFLLIIGAIVIAIIGNAMDEEKTDLGDRLAEALKKLEELSKQDPTTNINVARDFNGTLVTGDFYIKNSLDSIEKEDQYVSGALYGIGKYLLKDSEQDGIKRVDVERYINLQRVFAIGDAQSKQNVWKEFLESYPNIKNDVKEYLVIEEHVRGKRHFHNTGPTGGGF